MIVIIGGAVIFMLLGGIVVIMANMRGIIVRSKTAIVLTIE